MYGFNSLLRWLEPIILTDVALYKYLALSSVWDSEFVYSLSTELCFEHDAYSCNSVIFTA